MPSHPNAQLLRWPPRGFGMAASFYVVVFLGGVAGSLHCVGMCGIFPLTLSQRGAGGLRNLGRQLLYNLGRLNTLLCIGALSGYLGAVLTVATPFVWFADALALAAGALMMVIGLEILGIWRRLGIAPWLPFTDLLVKALGGFVRARSPLAPLTLGLVNALLPCQLIYAFATQAAATGSVVRGILTMLSFGLGTFPAMLLLGTVGERSIPRLRLAANVIAGSAITLFGALTVLRGLQLVPHHLH